MSILLVPLAVGVAMLSTLLHAEEEAPIQYVGKTITFNSGTVMIGNTTGALGAEHNTQRTQQFTTGFREGGYKLSKIRFHLRGNVASNNGQYSVRLFRGANQSSEEGEVASFGDNRLLSAATRTGWHELVPESETVLLPNTDYHLWFRLKPIANAYVSLGTVGGKVTAIDGWRLDSGSYFRGGQGGGFSWKYKENEKIALEIFAVPALPDSEIKPVISIDVSPRKIEEGDGTASVSATANPAPRSDVTLQVAVTPGLSSTEADYTLSSNTTLRIAAGATASTGTVTVTPVDDGVKTRDRRLAIGVTSDADVVVSRATTLLTIKEDDAVPPAPTNFTVREAPDFVLLEWQPDTRSDVDTLTFQYRIKVGDGSYGAWIEIPNSGQGGTNSRRYKVVNLVSDTRYGFGLRASDGVRYSDAVEVSAETFTPFTATLKNSLGFFWDPQIVASTIEAEFSHNFHQRNNNVFNNDHSPHVEYVNATRAATHLNPSDPRRYIFEVRPRRDAIDFSMTLKASSEPYRCTLAEAERALKICSADLRPLSEDATISLGGVRQVRLSLDRTSISERGGVATVNAKLYTLNKYQNDPRTGIRVYINVKVDSISTATTADYTLGNSDATLMPNRLVIEPGASVSRNHLTLTAVDNNVLERDKRLRFLAGTKASHIVLRQPSRDAPEPDLILTIEEDESGFGPPANFHLVPALNAMLLQWDPSPNSDRDHSYQYKYKVRGGEFSEWTAIPNSGRGEANHESYMLTGLVENKRYSIHVRAVDAENNITEATGATDATLKPYTVKFIGFNLSDYIAPDTEIQVKIRFDRPARDSAMLAPGQGTIVVEGGTHTETVHEYSPKSHPNFMTWNLTIRPDSDASEMVVRMVPGTPPHMRCAKGDNSRICSAENHPLTQGASHRFLVAQIPAAPANLRAEAGDAGVVLRWDATSGARSATRRQYRHAVDEEPFGEWIDIVDGGDNGQNGSGITIATGLVVRRPNRIQVRAGNVSGFGEAAEVTVTPVHNAMLEFDATLHSIRQVEENTPTGTAIGAPIAVRESDADSSLTYEVEGEDKESFAIDPTTGQILTKVELDFEVKTTYKVKVVVNDSNGGTGSIDVTIEVTDVFEPEVSVATRKGGESVTEGSGADAAFVFTRTGATAETLTVNIRVDEIGHFTSEAVSSVTFATNNATADLSFEITDDLVDERDGSISVTVEYASGYTVSAAKRSTSVTVVDNDDPASLPALLPSETAIWTDSLSTEAVAPAIEASLEGQSIVHDSKTWVLATLSNRPSEGFVTLSFSGTRPPAEEYVDWKIYMGSTHVLDFSDAETLAHTSLRWTESEKFGADTTPFGVGGTLNVRITDPTPLTASFTDMPESHGGETFSFELAFSESPSLSYTVLSGSETETSAIVVTGGAVTGAKRLVQGDNRRWQITVEPRTEVDVIKVELPPTTDCDSRKAICTIDGRPLSASIASTVQHGETSRTPPTPFTVSFEDVPADHDGTAQVIFRVVFNKMPWGYSYATMRDETLIIDQGRQSLDATKAKRLNAPHNDRWEITIDPVSKEDLKIAIAATADCEVAGAVCTQDGERLSNAIAATVLGPPAVSVADARVTEAEGATVDFTVTMSRASLEAVVVDYTTTDGTATADDDYTATTGTLTFAATETAKTVSVPVIDDAHDEGSESFTLTLSNLSGGNAWLDDATATGTIENTDAMPHAWLAQFGRTVATRAIDTIERRFDGSDSSHVRVGGWSPSPVGNGMSITQRTPRGLVNNGNDPGTMTRSMTGRELLLESAFQLSTGGESDSRTVTTWGRFATDGFDAEVDGTRLHGKAATGFVGTDVSAARWLTGIAISRNEGRGEYALTEGEDRGSVASSLTAMYPYAQLRLSETFHVWSLAGWGKGQLTLSRASSAIGTRAQNYTSGMSMQMGVVGARREMPSLAQSAGAALAVMTDALWVRTKTGTFKGGTGYLDTAQVDGTRLRLLVEGSRSFETGIGSIKSALELGLRHDEGVVETRTGIEAGATLRYEGDGFRVEGAVRTLVVNEESDYREWGASGALYIGSGPSRRGLSLSIVPSWGSAGSGAERLWSLSNERGLKHNGHTFAGRERLDAEAGYGLGLGSKLGIFTPYAGLSLGTGQAWRTGARWYLAPQATLSLEGTVEEAAHDDPTPTSGLILRGEVRW